VKGPYRTRNEENCRALAALIHKGKMGAFVGAGISRGVGYPNWEELVTRMRAEVADDPQVADTPTTDKLLGAELYRERMGAGRFAAFLQREFDPVRKRALLGTNRALKALVTLPFAYYVTTNFDVCVEEAFEIAHPGQKLPSIEPLDRRQAEEFVREPMKACLHWHGVYNRATGVVLAESDYQRLYFRESDFRFWLRLLFYQRRFLFVGASLEDQDMMYVLRELRAAVTEHAPHFALIPYDPCAGAGKKPEDRADELLHRYLIKAVFYPLGPVNSPNRFTALADLLEQLGETPTGGEGIPEDPEDPQKGRWGRHNMDADGRFALSAEVSPLSENWFHVRLHVRDRQADGRAAGRVIFHLHPTFQPDRRTVDMTGGEAELGLTAWGAFTVGALVEAAGITVKLELDLASLANTPPRFRMQ